MASYLITKKDFDKGVTKDTFVTKGKCDPRNTLYFNHFP